MDYFKVNKYSLVDENILYISSNIIELLKGSEKGFGKLIEQYQKKCFLDISVNTESNIYLAMLFLFVTGQVELKENKLKLVVR